MKDNKAMSKIEEAKRKYIEEHVSRNEYASFGAAFVAGAELQAKQSPWISVKDRLPKERNLVFTAGGTRSYDILLYDDGKFYQSLSQRVYDGSVTHWMPIPKFNE